MSDRRTAAFILLGASVLFFVLGMLYPLMQTGYGIGPIRFRQEAIYLTTSVKYFFNKNEYFIGILLLFFTIIFPILKYIFLLLTLYGKTFPRHKSISTILEIINKWSMLDVFIVAVLVLNMKFDSTIIVTRLDHGATLFAVSVLLLMSCSFVTRKIVATNGI